MRYALILVSVIVSGASLLADDADDHFPPAAVQGKWEGQARITVDWTTLKQLPVSLTIDENGSVTGKVGDAALVDGKIERGVGPIMRAIGITRLYVITADLNDPIIAAEQISRENVFIPVDPVNDQLIGDIKTSGSRKGYKADMALSATDMVLNHPGAAHSPATQPGAGDGGK